MILGFDRQTLFHKVTLIIEFSLFFLNASLIGGTRAVIDCFPSITDGVHRNKNFVEIIPVFSTFSNFFKEKKKNDKSRVM